MPDPWTILGWTLVAGLCLGVGAPVGLVMLTVTWWYVRDYVVIPWLSWRHRHIDPEAGQVWMQDGSRDSLLYIEEVMDTGRISICTRHPRHRWENGASWTDSPEQWAKRRANRRLVLVGRWDGKG